VTLVRDLRDLRRVQRSAACSPRLPGAAGGAWRQGLSDGSCCRFGRLSILDMGGRCRWQADGTWARLLAHAQTRSDAVGEVDWDVVVDATVVRAHQHAAGARKGDPAPT
jgi:hypothetical protein